MSALELAFTATGAGPPLLLLHGVVGSGRWWRRNVRALGAHFRVYCVDLAGFGASRGPWRFVLEEAAGQVAAWMDQAGLARAAVVGHSMGGLIAANLAAARPELVSRLVLVNAAALPLGPPSVRHLCGLLGLVPSLRLGFLPVLVTDTWRAGPITTAQAIRQLLAADHTQRLAAIRAPTLLIWGARDTLIPLRMGAALAARLPGPRLRIIPGAGHNPMWERPQAFNQSVLDFLLSPQPG